MSASISIDNGRSGDDGGLRIGASLGRFELRKRLGQGAQSTVWLAFDPRMEREVAIKVLRVTKGSDDKAVAQWLTEARSVGRVSHPNIVPVYEADTQDDKLYLVFEYVPGSTLAELIKRRGALPPTEAVALMMDVLDAIAVAHNAGVVHRDIKPSNILIDASGRARVMDFGIAARMAASAVAKGVELGGGTVGYLSPESANGEPPSPGMDIFSCGVLIAELLTGKPLINEADPYRALYRTVHEQLVLPTDAGADVDDRLRAIVSRALALDPKQRFSSARTFQLALEAYAKPAQSFQGDERGPSGSSTLEFLLRRMRHKSDFPALSDSIVRIQGMASSDKESVGSVTNEILKDVALTNKLLRMVNSAKYARGGDINTVSRAVALVGFNGIRNMALSLVLLDHMQDKTHAAQLKEEFLRSLMAGTIARELCPLARDGEEAFIGSMFQNLGRLLTQFYFPEEATQIRSMVRSEREPDTEAGASQRVLGLSFEDLGIGISKAWGLPDGIQRCMRKPAGVPPAITVHDSAERTRWVALVSNEIADVLLHTDPKDVDPRIAAVTARYARAIGSTGKEMHAATVKARQKMAELAVAMDIRVAPHAQATRLVQPPADPQAALTPVQSESDATLGKLELHATQDAIPEKSGLVPADHKGVAETLAAGIQDITNVMVEDFRLTDVLRMILETMFRALNFKHIIFCMRDARTETVVARFGLGEGVEKLVPLFKTHLKAATPDLFAMVSLKGVDSLITDATDSRIKQRLPQWYLQSINAPTFLLLPLQIKNTPFGLIYADKAQPGALELDGKELALLRTLRNQAIMAFKQST
ncbi:MAG: HDOD domain-containing protein [Rhodoferax sp.]|nr:HDOD domain-containing protein [Rhodoferax sp.]